MRRAGAAHVRTNRQKLGILHNSSADASQIRSALVHHQLSASDAVRRLEQTVLERQQSRVRRENQTRSVVAAQWRKRRLMRGESPRTGLLPTETIVTSPTCAELNPQLTYSQKVQEHRKLSGYGVLPHIVIDEEDILPPILPIRRPSSLKRNLSRRKRNILDRLYSIRTFFRMAPTKKKMSLPPSVPIIKEECGGEEKERPARNQRKSLAICENTCEALRRSFRKNAAVRVTDPAEASKTDSGRRRNSVFVKRGSISMEPIKKVDLEEVYTVNKQLGTGRFGYIKLAEHKQSKQKIAIKFFPRPQTKQVDFTREYNYSFFLSPHPHIIDTYEGMCQTSDDSAFFFVQEFCPRASLREAVEATNQQGIGEVNTKKVFAGIIAAIEFMHDENLVHRNLKAENILIFDVNDFSKVKVTDFGLTRKVDSNLKNLEYVNQYQAPELCETVQNEVLTVSRSSDIWSLGVIFFYCIRGRFPWQKATIMCKAYWEWEQWLKRKNPILPKKWLPFSEKALKLMKKTLTPRAKDRWTAKDMRKCITKEKLLKPVKTESTVEYVYHPTEFGAPKTSKRNEDDKSDPRKKGTLQHWISTTLSTMAEISEQVVSARDD